MPWTYIDDVLVDATPTEETTLSNVITDKPIEDGATIADHIANDPTILTLECTITGQEGWTAEEKYERLQEIAREKEVIEVVGALQVYENMAIDDISMIKDTEIGNGFRTDITLKQIRFVEQETVEVTLGVDPATDTQAQGEETEIETRDTETEELDAETSPSLIKSLFGDILDPFLNPQLPEEGEE